MAVGVALLILGAAVVVAVTWPGSNPELTRSGSASVDDLAGGDYRVFVMPAEAKDPATVTLTWTASAPMAVSWYVAYACSSTSGWCLESAPLASWSANLSGSWTFTGQTASLYGLWVEGDGTPNETVNCMASFSEQYKAGALSLPVVPFFLVLAAGSVLAGIGAVGTYLGLFLPSGTYADLAARPKAAPGEEEELPPLGPPE